MIPAIRKDYTIPKGARCQEASIFSRENYIACGQPAVAIVYHPKEHRGYYMCLGCADHNLHNRGGKLVVSINKALAKRYPFFVPPKPEPVENSSYTLGPLVYRESTGENHQWFVYQADGKKETTAIVFREEDARLYAKAPALFKVLQDLVQAHDEEPSMLTEAEWGAAREVLREVQKP